MPKNVNTNPNATHVLLVADEVIDVQGGYDFSSASIVFGYAGTDEPITVTDIAQAATVVASPTDATSTVADIPSDEFLSPSLPEG